MKISLLLPYWDRQKAAEEALLSIKRNYQDLEIIIVDDGSKVPFTWQDAKIIRLPDKDEPKSPVTCWNKAAEAATGDVLVLSCIEIIHDKPILEALCADLSDDEYRIASAWCPEENRWHTHSTVHVPDCPNGTGIGFCAAIKPALYKKAGGFNEKMRDGAGYEDRDWIKRLLKAGAKFNIRDDLRVIHPKTNASISWGREKFQRNLEIYRKDWDLPIGIVCLNHGNYLRRGADYVNVLADMVRKNMPDDVNWSIYCLTDNPQGLMNGIEPIILPEDIEGWWGKLWMFKDGIFPKGQRLLFMDLDTIILGSLEDIVKYDGKFAVTRDFYFPERVGPAIMAWESGTCTKVWSEWDKAGRPEHPKADSKQLVGDLWWINQLDKGEFAKRADKFQDLYPNQFVSYKADCLDGPPNGARVVCFHGTPRPHEAQATWVQNIWGGPPEVQYRDDQEALVDLNKRLDDNPNDMSLLFMIGERLLKMDRLGLATNIYRFLSQNVPNRAEIWNNLGRCYQTRDNSEHARSCFIKALELDSDSAPALINLAVLDVNEGQPERAVFLAQKALYLDPESRQARDVIAMGKLQVRDWSGWDDYIHSEGPPFRVMRQYRDPSENEWMGEPGKTVVIYREQGLGDEIVFASCLQEAIDASGKVIVDVDKRLKGLFQRSFPEADVYGTGHATDMDWPKLYDIDASAPFGRIPGFFRRETKDFPGKPYLKACPVRRKGMRAMLDSLGKGKKIGIAWTGGKRSDSITKADSDYRSFELEQIKPLLKKENHYISLEYRDVDLKDSVIHDWSWITQSNDYDDTAALVAELDYIISVPTTVVHLAGALGKTCYCLTPEHPNWRFGLEGKDMLWHKSVEQFRGEDRVKKLAKYLKKHEIIIK